MNNHEEQKKLISSYIDGATTQEEDKLVTDHILECKSCQTYYQELVKLSSTLQSWNDEELSPYLEQKIQKTLLDPGHPIATHQSSSVLLRDDPGPAFQICS